MSGLNKHRDDYMQAMLNIGYAPEKFVTPIFYINREWVDQIVADHIWTYRWQFDGEFKMNCIDFEPKTTSFEVTSTDQIYYLRSMKLW